MAGPEQYSDSVEEFVVATTRVRLLSLPSDLVPEAERLAKQEGRTKTEVLREAPRIVADTNIYISALSYAGTADRSARPRSRRPDPNLHLPSDPR